MELVFHILPLLISVVDPLHNILLGTPKHVITIWKEKGVFT